MIGGVEMIGNGEVALAVAIESFVAGRRNYPVVPAHVAEVNVQRPSLADIARIFSAVVASATGRSSRSVGVSDRALFVASIVGVREQQRLCLRPTLGTIVYASF